MRLVLLKLAAAAALSLTLAACNATTGIMPATGAGHISRVQVTLAPSVSSAAFAESVRAKATQHAARLPRGGAPKELRIAIRRHTYKNAALALLLTDANHVEARMAVVDVASGNVQGEKDIGAIDNIGGGVVGAVVAIAQQKERVDQRLADGLAKMALRESYGSAVVDPVLYRDDPVVISPRQDAAPAPAAAAKQAPAKPAATSRTASAQPAAAAR